MTKFTFIDIEALWDPELHRAYLVIVPDEADKRDRKGNRPVNTSTVCGLRDRRVDCQLAR